MVSEGRLTSNEIASNSNYDSMPRKPPVPLGTLTAITSRDLGSTAALAVADVSTLSVDGCKQARSVLLIRIYTASGILSLSPTHARPRNKVRAHGG